MFLTHGRTVVIGIPHTGKSEINSTADLMSLSVVAKILLGMAHIVEIGRGEGNNIVAARRSEHVRVVFVTHHLLRENLNSAGLHVQSLLVATILLTNHLKELEVIRRQLDERLFAALGSVAGGIKNQVGNTFLLGILLNFDRLKVKGRAIPFERDGRRCFTTAVATTVVAAAIAATIVATAVVAAAGIIVVLAAGSHHHAASKQHDTEILKKLFHLI